MNTTRGLGSARLCQMSRFLSGDRLHVSNDSCPASRHRRLLQPDPEASGLRPATSDAFAAYLSEPRGDRQRRVALQPQDPEERRGRRARRSSTPFATTWVGRRKETSPSATAAMARGCGRAPEEFWTIEPDHLDETLVLFDSRNPGSWDLADKELAKLIGEVSVKGPHVAVILDCCHSGSGTREIDTVVRRAPTDTRRRPIESFIVSPAEAEVASANRSAMPSGASWYAAPEGRHVLFAACRDDEEAKEYKGDGKHRGAFSFFLGDGSGAPAGVPTDRDLFTRASALVSNVARNQSPQLEATQIEDLDASFLDGTVQPMPATFAASYRDGRWAINGGATSGIVAPAGSDAPRLALYAFDAAAADLSDLSKAVAMVEVDEVLSASSRLAIDRKVKLDAKTTYKAVLVSLPTPPLSFIVEGDPTACGLVRDALKTASLDGKPSPFIREATEGDTPEFRLVARDNQFVITRPNDDRPIVGQIDGLDADQASLAVARLEHMARWTQTARLSNPASTIRPGDIKLAVLVDDKEVSGREIRLEYRLEDGREVEPTFKISMTNLTNMPNKSPRTLYCGLLDLTQRFRVHAGLLNTGSIKLEPGETAWAYQDRPIPATVPNDVWKQGIVEYKDMIKLIVCTDEFDARLLQQPSLDMPRDQGQTKGITEGETRGGSRDGTLNRLMQRIQTREAGESEAVVIDDWQATEFSLTTVRPLPRTPVPAPGQGKRLAGRRGQAGGGHSKGSRPGLAWRRRPLSTRDLGISLPQLLYDDPPRASASR